MNEERIKSTESGMLFFDLLVFLREVVRSQLGLITDPKTGEIVKNVEAARHVLNMVGSLEEKTSGNLTEQEDQVLSNFLSELRMACVRAEQPEMGEGG